MDLIRFKSVTKRYRLGDVDVVALDSVDFEVRTGDFVAITGPSGSGKTTMLNLSGCLDTPTEGEIHVKGEPVSAYDESSLDTLRSRTFGMVFQSFNLIPVLSAEENVALPLHLHALSAAEIRERVGDALRTVGLERFMSFRPDNLSGGQRQRVAIARALVTKPALIIADEPTASLDTENAMALVEMMKSLNQKQGVTFMFSTHDDRLLRHVDRVVELRDGRMMPSVRDASAHTGRLRGTQEG